MKRNTCLICSSSKIKKVLDLGYHSFADTFIPADRKYDNLPVYNLSCMMCEDCGNIQTAAKTDATDRYSLFDYSYTSSNSKISRDHWKKYCSECVAKLDIEKNSFVLEIGSNDGYLLEQFKKKGYKILGVDASPFMADLAKNKSIPTIVGLFNKKMAGKIIEQHGKANLVVANNVLNHSENPINFVQGVYDLLEEEGSFIYELPYWKCSVESEKIDQVYHEHVTYFTAKSSKELLERVGFKILSIEVVDYHGGSLRVFAKKTSKNMKCEKLYDMISNEQFLFNEETYVQLTNSFNNRKNKLLKTIYDIKSRGDKLLAIGAAAKGNTLLNLLNVDNTTIDWVTDVSLYKQGKLTPLTNIPICDDNIILNYDKVYALILSWNLSEKIKEKLKSLNPQIHFINFYEEENK